MDLLKTVITSLISSAFFITIWQTLILKIINSKIDSNFSKKIEHYKHELNTINENTKFEYARWSTDFNLYTNKKHTVYQELFRLISIADGMLESLIGFRQIPSFEEYGKKDMYKYLIEYPVVEGKVNELLKNWNDNSRNNTDAIRSYLYLIDFNKADTARNEAKNYYILNQLYISDLLEEMIKELFSNMVKQFVINKQQIIEGYYNESSSNECQEATKIKNNLILEIKKKMKDELSIGYYDQ